MKILNKMFDRFLDVTVYKGFREGVNMGTITQGAVTMAHQKCPLNLTSHDSTLIRKHNEAVLAGEEPVLPDRLKARVETELNTLKVLATTDDVVVVKCFGELPKNRRCTLMGECDIAQERGAVVPFPKGLRV